MGDDDDIPLLVEAGNNNLRKRVNGDYEDNAVYSGESDEKKEIFARKKAEWTDLINFNGRHYLARVKKQDDCLVITFEILLVVAALLSMYFCYFHFQWFQFTILKGYARIGHPHAQHIVGERLLHGKGVEQDKPEAMTWFRKAADQGHPHSSYNLAIGHLNGIETDVKPGEAHDLIRHAADKGVKEASDTMENACKLGKCN